MIKVCVLALPPTYYESARKVGSSMLSRYRIVKTTLPCRLLTYLCCGHSVCLLVRVEHMSLPNLAPSKTSTHWSACMGIGCQPESSWLCYFNAADQSISSSRPLEKYFQYYKNIDLSSLTTTLRAEKNLHFKFAQIKKCKLTPAKN